MDTKLDKVYEHARAGEYSQAEALCRKIIKDDSKNFEAHLLLADILWDNKKKAQSKKYFSKLIKENPKQIQTYLHLGLVLEEENKFSEAIETYAKARGLGDKDPILNYRIGKALLAYSNPQRDEQQALYYLRLATSAEIDLADAYISLADIETGGRAKAILKRGLQTIPNSVEIKEHLAKIYLRNEEFSQLHDLTKSNHATQSSSPILHILNSLAYYQEDLFEEALKELGFIPDRSFSDEANLSIDCFKGILLTHSHDFEKAQSTLRGLIEVDIQMNLSGICNLVLVWSYALSNKFEAALDEINDLPMEDSLTSLYFPGSGSLDLRQIFRETIEILQENLSPHSESAFAKLVAFLVTCFYFELDIQPTDDEDETKEVRDTILSMQEEIALAIKYFPKNPDLNHVYGKVLSIRGKEKSAMGFLLFAAFFSTRFDAETGLYEGLEEDSKAKHEYIEHLERCLANADKKQRSEFAEAYLHTLVTFFFSKKDYKTVLEITKNFTYKEQLKAPVLFEIAYSYVETGDKNKGREIYRKILEDFDADYATLNNLAILLEENEELHEALDLLSKAEELSPEEEKVATNTLRIKNKLEEREKDLSLTAAAKVLFLQESSENKEFVAKLYKLANNENIIYVNPREFAKTTFFSVEETVQKISQFVEMRYLQSSEAISESKETLVLKLNSDLEGDLELIVEALNREEEERLLAKDLSRGNLQSAYGFGPELVAKLAKVNSVELRTILERDLREAAFAMGTKSSKTVLILCGSVIEAVLLDQLLPRKTDALSVVKRILARDGRKIPKKFEKLENWDLYFLLEAALGLRIINSSIYHLGNGLRGFRNVIHPGVEKRGEIEVAFEFSAIAWTVVKQLLNEIPG